MLKRTLLSIMLLACVALAGPSLAADEPTLHQVYQAADAGRLAEAQGIMDKVLRDHPNSAKAHFVEAELLVKQNRIADAQVELNKADILAPGLPFAKPAAVESLRRHLTSTHSATSIVQSVNAPQIESMGGIPWGLLLVALGLIAAAVFFVRSMARRSTNVLPVGGGSAYGTGFGPGAPLQPYGAGGVTPAMGPAPGGIGSGILGGLATGAALGAGMVAGQALMHHFTDGNRNESGLLPLPSSSDRDITPNDMGGTDFGVADSSSWDDSSSSGGSDWE
jgi:hypothetical protein